jgi:protein phosphatase
VVIGVLVLLAAALGAFYAWTQTQYFVGRNGDTVAIYQGVDTDIGPISFYSLYENEPSIPYEKLSDVDRMRVDGGITAASKNDAEHIVKRLHGSLTKPHQPVIPLPIPPICPTTSAGPQSTASTPTGPHPSGTRRSSAPRTSTHHSRTPHKGTRHATSTKHRTKHPTSPTGQQQPGPGSTVATGAGSGPVVPSPSGTC